MAEKTGLHTATVLGSVSVYLCLLEVASKIGSSRACSLMLAKPGNKVNDLALSATGSVGYDENEYTIATLVTVLVSTNFKKIVVSVLVFMLEVTCDTSY